ncbi:hypothetical protein [Flavicella marina]|uniref:hypothetical protein n=1 Tax=Flavicella marina TaxID=1475951 RepID=UPI001263FA46|nr:hypothetical protein [Flavicella marina]
MKTAMKRTIRMCILLVGLMTYAENGDPKPAMEVTSVNEDSFLLVMSQVEKEMSLVIKDQYGFVLYLDQIEAGGKYKKTYNISSLPDGTYYIQVLDDDFSTTYAMAKEADSMVIKVDFSTPLIEETMLAILMN